MRIEPAHAGASWAPCRPMRWQRDRARIHVMPGGAAADAALAAAEVVFEGVPETLEAKREAFARICAAGRAGRDPRLDHLHHPGHRPGAAGHAPGAR